MPDGEVGTTLRQMSDWLDLSNVVSVAGFAVDMMTVVTEDGAGRAVFLRLIDGADGQIVQLLIDPQLAGQIGWETIGVVNGYMGSLLEELDIELEAADIDDEDDE